MKHPEFDAIGLTQKIDELARFSEAPAPAVTRVVFSREDLAARAFVREQAEALGLVWTNDAVGNQFALWPGLDSSLPPVATGSHIDAIPNAGKFDGVVGVLGALEAIRALKQAGFQPMRGIEVIVVTAEEPTRYGVGCLGSRLLSGALSPAEADKLSDAKGERLENLRLSVGCRGSLDSVRQKSGRWSRFVELHIEQGPELEQEQLDIGVVTKIAGPSAYRILLEGAGGHAGAVLMPGRHDALLAGAEIALAVETAALTSPSEDTVATTGIFQIHPGAINSIPSEARLGLDLRDTDLAAREGVRGAVYERMAEICQRRGVRFQWEKINEDPPVLCDAALVETCLRSAAKEGFAAKSMISRAYHDSLFMAQICPTAMIFVPCFRGFSHRPDEFSSPEQIIRGVRVLAAVLVESASR